MTRLDGYGRRGCLDVAGTLPSRSPFEAHGDAGGTVSDAQRPVGDIRVLSLRAPRPPQSPKCFRQSTDLMKEFGTDGWSEGVGGQGCDIEFATLTPIDLASIDPS
tara:strand:- start:211 stop:525 length:315 start_codon:yes stop_codon:yes gene_type:complete